LVKHWNQSIRYLKPGGSIQVLEFSKAEKIIEKPYGIFLNNFIPFLGNMLQKMKIAINI
jgi:ubiquinone/menaquinone biosynthesis C-methylase UbiE